MPIRSVAFLTEKKNKNKKKLVYVIHFETACRNSVNRMCVKVLVCVCLLKPRREPPDDPTTVIEARAKVLTSEQTIGYSSTWNRAQSQILASSLH